MALRRRRRQAGEELQKAENQLAEAVAQREAQQHKKDKEDATVVQPLKRVAERNDLTGLIAEIFGTHGNGKTA